MKEELLKKYFLGNISPAESENLEEEIALSAELTEEAQIVESELLDEYLRGNLSASERELFETNYLTTEARREQLRFAEIVWRVAHEQKKDEIVLTEKQSSFWQIWHSWRVAFVGFAAILLLGVFVFLWLKFAEKEEIVQRSNTNQSSAPKIENQNNPPLRNANIANQTANITANSKLPINKNASPTPEIKPTQTPKVIEQSAPTLATFTLLPGILRGAGEQFIKIAPNTNKISLRLNLPKNASKYQSYTATVKTTDGETVFIAPNLKSFGLILPADKLEDRPYIIFLEGQNAQNPPESIAEYSFRVRR